MNTLDLGTGKWWQFLLHADPYALHLCFIDSDAESSSISSDDERNVKEKEECEDEPTAKEKEETIEDDLTNELHTVFGF